MIYKFYISFEKLKLNNFIIIIMIIVICYVQKHVKKYYETIYMITDKKIFFVIQKLFNDKKLMPISKKKK